MGAATAGAAEAGRIRGIVGAAPGPALRAGADIALCCCLCCGCESPPIDSTESSAHCGGVLHRYVLPLTGVPTAAWACREGAKAEADDEALSVAKRGNASLRCALSGVFAVLTLPGVPTVLCDCPGAFGTQFSLSAQKLPAKPCMLHDSCFGADARTRPSPNFCGPPTVAKGSPRIMFSPTKLPPSPTTSRTHALLRFSSPKLRTTAYRTGLEPTEAKLGKRKAPCGREKFSKRAPSFEFLSTLLPPPPLLRTSPLSSSRALALELYHF